MLSLSKIASPDDKYRERRLNKKSSNILFSEFNDVFNYSDSPLITHSEVGRVPAT